MRIHSTTQFSAYLGAGIASPGADGALVLSPKDSDYPRIIIEPSEVLKGDFRKNFEARAGSSRGSIDVIDTQKGFKVLKTDVRRIVRDQDVRTVYVACNPGDRYEQVTFANFPGGFEVPRDLVIRSSNPLTM